jgi:hypothetical protein
MRRCFKCCFHSEGSAEEQQYNEHLRSKEHEDNHGKQLDVEEQALIDKYN